MWEFTGDLGNIIFRVQDTQQSVAQLGEVSEILSTIYHRDIRRKAA